MRDHAHTLSDFRVPTLSIECEPCGRAGRYNVAKLMEQHGDARLPELTRYPKWKSRAHYGGPEATGSSLRHVDVQQLSVSRGLSIYSG